MLLAFDPQGAVAAHQCATCGAVTPLNIAPARGDLVVSSGCLTTKPCPTCGDVECYRTDLDPVDAGEARHPRSLVGTHLSGGNEVIQDSRDRQDNPARVAQARLLRQMQRHPHLATIAPRNDRMPR